MEKNDNQVSKIMLAGERNPNCPRRPFGSAWGQWNLTRAKKFTTKNILANNSKIKPNKFAQKIILFKLSVTLLLTFQLNCPKVGIF